MAEVAEPDSNEVVGKGRSGIAFRTICRKTSNFAFVPPKINRRLSPWAEVPLDAEVFTQKRLYGQRFETQRLSSSLGSVGVTGLKNTFSSGPNRFLETGTYLGVRKAHCELNSPLHDRSVFATSCGRICLHRKKINVIRALSGQRLGIRELEENTWLIWFIDYDFGSVDLDEKCLQPLEKPFGALQV